MAGGGNAQQVFIFRHNYLHDSAIKWTGLVNAAGTIKSVFENNTFERITGDNPEGTSVGTIKETTGLITTENASSLEIEVTGLILKDSWMEKSKIIHMNYPI